MSDPDDRGPTRRRGCEVRPTWTAEEWAQVSTAATAAAIPPATWVSQVVIGGLIPGRGLAPARCSRRALLWGQILERWQSTSWAMVSLRDRVPADEWATTSGVVGRAGVVITGQADPLPDLERRCAAEACRAATTSLITIGPGARPGARLARSGSPDMCVHRAKVTFAPADHDHLREACVARGWNVSDYVAAVSTLTASLTRAVSGEPDDLDVLDDILALARDVTSRALGMLGTPGALDPTLWASFVEVVAEAWALIDAARAEGRGSTLDAWALIPQALAALGWAATRAVDPR